MMEHRSTLKRAMLNNSRTTNSTLSPISESALKVEASAAAYQVSRLLISISV